MSYPLAKVHGLQVAKERQQIKGKHGGGPANQAEYEEIKFQLLVWVQNEGSKKRTWVDAMSIQPKHWKAMVKGGC